MLRQLGVAAVALLAAMPTHAQQGVVRGADPLAISLSRVKIAVANGKEVSERADVAKPGDVLEEVATYRNTSSGALKDFVPMLPVPPNTELVLGSVRPANAKASTDGRTFSDMPLKRKVRQANGVEIEQPVPLSEYRFLRWFPGELGAGKSMTFSARFKLSDSLPPVTVPGQK